MEPNTTLSAVTDTSGANFNRAALRNSKISLSVKLAYSAGAVVEGMMSALINTFLLFYVTTVCGMSAVLAGAAIATGLVVDAVADPLIGSASDNLHSRFGRRLPFMLIALPVIACSFIAIFSLPDWSNQTAMFILLAFLSMCIRTSISAFHLPFLTIAAELTDDHVERSRIMAFNWGFAMIGALSGISIAFSFFFNGPGGLAHREMYTPFALTLSLLVLLAGVISMRAVYLTRDRQHLPPTMQTSLIRRLVPEVIELFRNRSFRLLFGAALLFFIAFGVTQSLALHVNTFFWHLESGKVQLVTVAFIAGTLIGAPLTGPIISRNEKRTSVLIGISGWVIAQIAPASLRLLGLLPLEGHALSVFLALVAGMGGALMALAAIAFTSMMADAADEHEYIFGARREGLFYAGWAFAGKTAGSIGILLSGMLLTAINFPVEKTKVAGIHITLPESMVHQLGFIYGPGAGLLSLLGAIFLMQYKLTRAKHSGMVSELRERRQRDETKPNSVFSAT